MITVDLRGDQLEQPWAPPSVQAPSDGDVPSPAEGLSATGTSTGSLDRARWERPALVALLAISAGMFLWGLSDSGWANSFYSAAAQAGSQSWKALFFGSSDAANSITVDKPPASLWIMGLSVRIFGLSSWSILVPQALMGVGTVGVVYAAVRRRFTAWAALLAGAVMATTPVAALMFRFNNPDALLVLLMTLAAFATMRGIEDGRRRWIVLTGALIGFGFLAKQLQVLLILPPLAFAYLLASPVRLRRRISDLLIGGAAMVAAAGWWLAIVELTPSGMRPFIGGSQNNSILDLTFGYNGFGRLTGNETGSVGTGMWGKTGITRMFDGVMGGQIAWLIPAALIFTVTSIWVSRRAPRTDLTRAAMIIWGGWLLVTGLVFSFMAGIFHEYYTVALAPAIAVLIGIGADLLWRRRNSATARMVLAAVVITTAIWSSVLLGRAPGWNSWLRTTIVVGAIAAAIAIIVGHRLSTKLATSGAIAAAAVCLAGPTAWAIQTVATPHSGSIVTAGPTVPGGRGGPGGFPGGGPGGFPGRGFPGGAFPGGGNPPPNGFPGGGAPGGGPGSATGGPPIGANGPPGGGGLLNSTAPSSAIVAALLQDSGRFTWVAAAIGSNEASGFQLATEQPVMAIGGFNGSDPSPTLAQFQDDVALGRIHYFIAGGGFGPQRGGSNDASQISTWVTENFTAKTIDGVTLYDLTPGLSG
jgi:4-amino-4-deoxy-L-arabinose transferase-like glycosyltransferase